MALTSMSISEVIDPGVKKHFVDEYTMIKPQLSKIFNVGKQTSKTDEYENYTGLANVATVPEMGTYPEDLPIKAYGVSITPVKKGLLFPVTMEMRKWAKANEIWDGAKHLARALARDVEIQAASVLNNSQDTDYTSMTDTKPLGSTDHTRADGGSAQSNASATGIVFSETNLEVGLLALEEGQKDDRGQVISIFGDRIIIPPALRKEVLVALKSDGRSDSADNDTNVYNSMQEYYGSIDILIWDYLAAANGGSDTRWFLEDKSTSKLMWQWAIRPKTEREDKTGFKQDVVNYKGMYYAGKGWRDWRGLWISAGDTAAYSD